jgi:hypothetical protein
MTDILAGMTKAEKQALHDRLSYELKSKRSAASYTSNETEVWECLLDALGSVSRMPLPAFVDKFGLANYRTAAAEIEKYVASACPADTRKPVRLALTTELLRCLVSHLNTRTIPATPGVMLRSLMVLPFAVEQRYPGYAQARMLHRIISAPPDKD